MNKQELLSAMRLAAGRRQEAKHIVAWAEENLKEVPYEMTADRPPLTDQQARSVIEKSRRIIASMGLPADAVPSDPAVLAELLAARPRIPSFRLPKEGRRDGKTTLVFLRPEDADAHVPPPHTAVADTLLTKNGKRPVLFLREQSLLAPFWVGLAALRACLVWAVPAHRFPHGNYQLQSNRLAFGLINDATAGGLRRTLRQAQHDREQKRIGALDARNRLVAEVQAKIPGPHPDNLPDILLTACAAIAGYLILPPQRQAKAPAAQP